jgi:hypothetical protein
MVSDNNVLRYDIAREFPDLDEYEILKLVEEWSGDEQDSSDSPMGLGVRYCADGTVLALYNGKQIAEGKFAEAISLNVHEWENLPIEEVLNKARKFVEARS